MMVVVEFEDEDGVRDWRVFRDERDAARQELEAARAAYDRMLVARDEAADELAENRQMLDSAQRAVGLVRDAQARWERRAEVLESELRAALDELEVARGTIRGYEARLACRPAGGAQEVEFTPARASRREPVDAATAGAIEAFGLTSVPEPRGNALGHEQEPEGPELERLRGELDAMRLFRDEHGVGRARLGQLRVAGQVGDELYLVDGQEVYRVRGEWVPPPVEGEWPPARDDDAPEADESVVPPPRVQRTPMGGLVLRCACGAGFAHLPDYITHWYADHDMTVQR